MHTIRPARADDAPTISAFNQAMAVETEGRALDAGTVDRGVAAVFGDTGRAFYLIAESEGQPVGQLMCTTEWSDWRDGTFWWIQSVYVEPDHRRRGVYRALHEHLTTLARETDGVCGIRLYVDHDNETAQATYHAMGMQAARYQMFEVDFVLE